MTRNVRTGRAAKLRELFLEAADLESNEREAFLEANCGDDEELRKELEGLLSSDPGRQTQSEPDPSGPIHSDPIHRAVEQVATDLVAEPLRKGDSVGAFVIEGRLGRGGMGSVFLGQRADGVVRQTVAIKVLSAHATSVGRDRFEQERQILADLDHPNIARLLDGGELADGRPYLVMEYVAGSQINAYCDQHQLGLRERLELWCQACQAVEFAHQRLVVHRDLKPPNLLVTEEGVPKLLDFGVARLQSPDASNEKQGPLSGGLNRILTPGYASPEQIRGEQVTTATDVYGLGLLLYELVTGEPAQKASSSDMAELEREVLDNPPAPPTALWKQRGAFAHNLFARRAGADLDAIVAKALEVEHSDRYASAKDLRDDVERCLRLEPVSLSSHRVTYRARRLLQRHPMASSGVAVALAALLVLLAALERERSQAQQEATAANEISDFLVETLSFADPKQARGEDVSVISALQSGVEGLEEKLADQPLLQARIRTSIGTVLRNLGQSEQAVDLHRTALATLERERPRSPLAARALARLGAALVDLGELEEGEDRLQQSITLLHELGHEQSVLMVDALNQLSLAQYERFEVEKALATNEAASEMDRALGLRTELSGKLVHNRGLFLGELGRHQEALIALRSLADERREMLGPDHPSTLSTLRTAAVQASALGDKTSASEILLGVLAECRRVYGDEHVETAVVLNELANVWHDLAQFDLAEPLYTEAIDTARKLGLRANEPIYVNNLAALYRDVGDAQQAARLFAQSAEVRAEVYGETNLRTVRAEINLASALVRLGEFEQAGALLAEARRKLEALDGDNSRLFATSMQNEGRRLLGMKRPEAALEWFRKAETTLQDKLRDDHPTFGSLALDRGRALAQLGDVAGADAQLRLALQLLESLGPEHLLAAEAKVELADLVQTQGDSEQARALLGEASPVLQSKLRENAPQLLRLSEVQRKARRG